MHLNNRKLYICYLLYYIFWCLEDIFSFSIFDCGSDMSKADIRLITTRSLMLDIKGVSADHYIYYYHLHHMFNWICMNNFNELYIIGIPNLRVNYVDYYVCSSLISRLLFFLSLNIELPPIFILTPLILLYYTGYFFFHKR